MDPYDAALSAVYRLDRHDEIVRVLHLRTSLSRRHRHVMSLTLTRPGGDDVLPPRARVVRTVRAGGGETSGVSLVLVVLLCAVLVGRVRGGSLDRLGELDLRRRRLVVAVLPLAGSAGRAERGRPRRRRHQSTSSCCPTAGARP